MKKKFGEFLTKLRKEKGLSQYDLAELIPIGREAISKWERGITKPSKSSLLRLSEILEISIEELEASEKFEKYKKQKKKNTILNLYEERNQLKKKLLISIGIIFILILLLLIYYFLNHFNSIKVFTISYNDNIVNIDGGILTTTKEKIYFNIGNITTNEKILNLKLYYKDTNNDNKLIFSTNTKYIILYDYYGYNAYFDYNQVDYIIKNMYLDIEFENMNYTIKLNVKKDFVNNKIFIKKVKQISNKVNSRYTNKVDDTLIKEKFKKIDDMYVYKGRNLTLKYIEEAYVILMEQVNDKNRKEWYYILYSDFIDYKEYFNNKIIIDFSYDGENVNCVISDCENYKEEVNYFHKKLSEIIIKK